MPIDIAKAKELFLAVLEMPGPERLAYLDTACVGDTALRQRIEAMLRTHENSGELLPRAADEMLADSGVTEADATAAFPRDEPGTTAPSEHAQSDVKELHFLAPSAKPGHLGRLDHYEIQEIIGKGGFGIVLKAFDERLHRVVAIKVLSPAYAANGSARKRFIREAQTAAAVKSEHVVAIHSVEDDAQPPYLVMEMIDGVSLQEKIDKNGALSVKEIFRIGLQTAEGLAAAHKQGLVHRDIKPANILLENGVERVKITDFGLARAVDDASVTQSGMVAGTPMYMSPEQAEGLQVDHRSDLFSLATVLYAMCTGHPPFRASGTHAVMKRVIDASPRPIREINSEIPDWLSDMISKLHAKKPEDRFQTAREVAELLGQRLADVQAGRAPMARSPVTLLPPEPRRMRPQWPAALALIGMGALFTYAAVMLFRLQDEQISPPGVQWLVAIVGLGMLVSGVFVAIRSLRRQRRVFAIASLALIVFVVSAIWAGPFVLRYLGNRGEVEIIPESGWVSVIVHKDGNAVTDWFGVRTHPTIQLPAGTYTFPPGFGPGRRLEHWEVTTHGLFFSQTLLQFNRDPVFEVARGERVTLRAIMRDEPLVAKVPNPPEEPGWVQLFNGKDLTGWKAQMSKNLIPELAFEVFDGVLISRGQPLGYLRTEKPYQNFILEFECQGIKPFAEKPNWAGDLLFGVPVPDRGLSQLAGYAMRISPGMMPTDGLHNLTVLDERSAVDWRAFKPTWNQIRIEAKPDGLTIFLNGEKVSKSFNYKAGKGYIGIMAVGHGMRYRNIRIKDLNPPESEAPEPLVFTDPDGDCRWTRDIKRITITVPAGAHHFSVKKANLPRLLQEIEGDFVAEVSLPPLTLVPVDALAWGEHLMVWNDDQNVLAVHRVVGAQGGKPASCNVLSVSFRDGKSEIGKITAVPSNRTLDLKVERVGEQIKTSFREEGKAWREGQTFDVAGWPKKLRVGMAVSNKSTAVFAAHFDEFRVRQNASWVQLFNGKDLDGWKKHPVEPGDWKVENGLLIGSGRLGYLFSERGDYQNFHLRVQAKLNAGGDSGVFFRSRLQPLIDQPEVKSKSPAGYEVQINSDSLKTRTGSLFFVETGGESPSLTREDRVLTHPNQWCTLEVIADGPWLTVTVNGERTAYVKNTAYARGHLALQVWPENTVVQFKKIEIKELPPEEPGWVQLFNGTDLDGWETFAKGTGRWKIVDGSLTCEGPRSYLFTKRDDYKDFHFRVEARLNAKGNSGQYFRSRFEPGWPKGYYAQINNSDPAAGTRTGALNRVTLSGGFETLANVPGGLVLDNAWFTQEVIAKGNHIQILLNGKKVVDYIDKDNMYKQGRLALEHMTEPTRVEFRKIEIKGLPPLPAPMGAAKKGVADFAEIHDADEKTFDGWIEQLKKDDLRPVRLSVQTADDAPRFTAIAIRDAKHRDWKVTRIQPGMDARKHVDAMRRDNFEAVAQAVYGSNGAIQRTLFWLQDVAGRTEGIWFGDEIFVGRKIRTAEKIGARVVSRAGLRTGPKAKYAIISNHDDGLERKEEFDLTFAELKAWIEKMQAGGRRPDDLHAHGTWPETRFGAVIIQDKSKVDWAVSWALTPPEYDAERAPQEPGLPPASGHRS